MADTTATEKVLFFRNRKGVVIILLVLFLLGGIGIRLIDFTDMPMEFGGTRQFHSLILTRGLYYQLDTPDTLSMPQEIREFGIMAGNAEPVIEPPILENLVVLTYRLMGGENIFVGRAYSILFWVIGGIPLFLLARKLMPINGAFAVLAFYLFTHFGVYVSRSFQPDPMVVMFMLWALYFQVRWAKSDTLKNSILAGLFTGLSIFLKVPMVFFTGVPFAVLVLQKGFKYWIKNGRVYLMVVLSILPALLYYLYKITIEPDGSAILAARFIPQLLIQLQWYVGWVAKIKDVAGHFALMIGLFAFFIISVKENRLFYGSLLLGYLLFGIVFNYHIYTHNYYHLPLLPILALGFGFVFSVLYQKLEEINQHKISQMIILALFIFSLGLCVIRVRRSLIANDYRSQPAFWYSIGQKIGPGSSVIALTQDYGYLLSYWGYINPSLWPKSSDALLKDLLGASDPEFTQLFKELTSGKSAFLITDLEEFNRQTELKEYLNSNYTVDQGEGYYIYRFDQPLESGN